MKFSSWTSHQILRAAGLRNAWAFNRASRDLKRHQQKVLLNLIRRNRDSQFGIQHQFSKITSYEEFVNQVPLQSWSDIEPWIEKVLNQEKNVLTTEHISGFELTSGTTLNSKKVPMTDRLKQEFYNGVAVSFEFMYRR